MAQDPSTPRYRIYLLTMWEERSRDPQTPVQWRFSLEHPATGQRRGFASLAVLVASRPATDDRRRRRLGQKGGAG